MKKFLLASSVAIAALTTGFAASAQALSDNSRAAILQYVPDADLSNLTLAQMTELELIVSDSSGTKAGANPSGAIMAVLDGSSARNVSQFQLSEGQKTQIRLALPSVEEARLENLSTAQMAQLSGLFGTDEMMIGGAQTASAVEQILMGDTGTTVASVGLSSADQATIKQLVPEAQLDVLTVNQLAELTSLLANDANLSTGANPAAKIRIILGL